MSELDPVSKAAFDRQNDVEKAHLRGCRRLALYTIGAAIVLCVVVFVVMVSLG